MRHIKHFLFIATMISIFTISYTKEEHIAQHEKEKPIVVVIPSYNNKDWYKKNLDSVFNQKYENYRVIYINDRSPDSTGQLVEKYVKKCNQTHRFTLINNEKNAGALANLYKTIHTCQDDEIIAQLDGDDWFAHNNVLQKINAVYQDPNIWMTYGQYETLIYSKSKKKFYKIKGGCKAISHNIVRANAYRENRWKSSALRTFYAGLFKQIKLEDLIENGSFYKVTWDLAMIFPMLEMSGGRFKFIDEILYTYNCITALNDFKMRVKEQLHTENIARAKPKYKAVASIYHPIDSNQNIDIIILSDDTSNKKVSDLIESIHTYALGVGNIYVLHNSINLKNAILEKINQSPNKCVMFAKDTMRLHDFVNFSECAELVEQTYAYGFFLSLGKNTTNNCNLVRDQKIPPSVPIKNDILAWKFEEGEYEFRTPNNLNMTIYRKKDIVRSLKNLIFSSCQDLEHLWNNELFDLYKVGLFFEKAKTVTR